MADLKKQFDEASAKATSTFNNPLETAQKEVEAAFATEPAASRRACCKQREQPPIPERSSRRRWSPRLPARMSRPPKYPLHPQSLCAQARRQRMSHRTPEDEDEVEQSKAPLLDHLIELRSRLIKALIAFAVCFAFCFFFAKQIYNILVWPFVWVAGIENSKFIYTALLEYFMTQLKLAMFGAAFLAFPVSLRRSICSWRRASIATSARLSFRI